LLQAQSGSEILYGKLTQKYLNCNGFAEMPLSTTFISNWLCVRVDRTRCACRLPNESNLTVSYLAL
jgi:hypothetical protein